MSLSTLYSDERWIVATYCTISLENGIAPNLEEEHTNLIIGSVYYFHWHFKIPLTRESVKDYLTLVVKKNLI